MAEPKKPRIEFLRATYEDDKDKKRGRTKTVEYGIWLPITTRVEDVFSIAKDFIISILRLPELALEQFGSESNAFRNLQVVQNGLRTYGSFWEMSFTTRCDYPVISQEEYEEFIRAMEERKKKTSGKE